MLVLEDRIKQRRANNEFYRKGLEKVEGISFQTEPSSDYFSNYWLTSILVDSLKTGGKTREDLYDVLNENNIESRPLWKPMHMQPIFSGCPYYGDGTSERLFRDGLCLPSGTSLSFENVDRVIKAIESMF